ncbi:MAG: serine hydrolase domain-containing protein [Microbacterium sp.]
MSIAAVTLIAVVGAIVGGSPPSLAPQQTGDAMLAADAAPHLGGTRHRVSLCVLQDGDFTTAGFGADENTRYEVGSITKTFTGALLADAVSRGEVGLEDPVGAYLDLDGTPAADVTLRELAGHTGGLGEWGDDARDDTVTRWWVEDVLGATMHDLDLDDLLDRAREDVLATRGEHRYSNIGYALLGHALAAAGGRPYPELLQRRVFDAVGMSDSGLTAHDDVNTRHGFQASGRAAPRWRLGAYAPAGGGYSTAADLCRYAERMLEVQGAAPGRPNVFEPIDVGMGLGWNLSVSGDRAWKTGQVGGFTALIGMDLTDGRAVVALSDTANELDDVVWALLETGR